MKIQKQQFMRIKYVVKLPFVQNIRANYEKTFT